MISLRYRRTVSDSAGGPGRAVLPSTSEGATGRPVLAVPASSAISSGLTNVVPLAVGIGGQFVDAARLWHGAAERLDRQLPGATEAERLAVLSRAPAGSPMPNLAAVVLQEKAKAEPRGMTPLSNSFSLRTVWPLTTMVPGHSTEVCGVRSDDAEL